MAEGAAAAFQKMMAERLVKKPWILDYRALRVRYVASANVSIFRSPSVLPDFSVGCRRLTPGPGYLEALCEDNVGICMFAGFLFNLLISWSSTKVDYIPSQIKRITATGIETEDGQHIDLDVIICATGSCFLYLIRIQVGLHP